MSIRTAADVLAQNLPKLVRLSQARVALSHELFYLPGHAFRLVQVLASYTPLNALHSPLIFNRKTPAAVLRVSTRTIDRMLNVLVTYGLIERVKQKRHGVGVWDCTSVKWSADSINGMFKPIPVASGVSGTTKQNNQPPAPFMAASDSLPGVDNRATNLSHKSGPLQEVFTRISTADASIPSRESSGNDNADPVGIFKIVKYSFPKDLIEPAQKLGLLAPQICYLMSLCKTAKQRLQAVLDASIQTMIDKGLRGRAAVAWIRKLLSSGRDFSYIAKVKAKEVVQAKVKAKKVNSVRRLAEKLNMPGLAIPEGMTIVEVVGSVALLAFSNTKKPAGSIPVLKLAETLLRKEWMWVKGLLRGVHQVTCAAVVQEENVVREPISKKASESIAAMRAMLRRRSAQ